MCGFSQPPRSAPCLLGRTITGSRRSAVHSEGDERRDAGGVAAIASVLAAIGPSGGYLRREGKRVRELVR